ncbi:MAG: hypothetical protein KKH01_10205 [Firmicutes bacterium]|nr:hypothetical protein [Bacillota bacterium]
MKTYFKVEHKHKLIDHYERKLIGIYSSSKNAEMVIKILQSKPGFKDTPEGFIIKKIIRLSKYRFLDNTYWVEGYDTYTY